VTSYGRRAYHLPIVEKRYTRTATGGLLYPLRVALPFFSTNARTEAPPPTSGRGELAPGTAVPRALAPPPVCGATQLPTHTPHWHAQARALQAPTTAQALQPTQCRAPVTYLCGVEYIPHLATWQASRDRRSWFLAGDPATHTSIPQACLATCLEEREEGWRKEQCRERMYLNGPEEEGGRPMEKEERKARRRTPDLPGGHAEEVRLDEWTISFWVLMPSFYLGSCRLFSMTIALCITPTTTLPPTVVVVHCFFFVGPTLTHVKQPTTVQLRLTHRACNALCDFARLAVPSCAQRARSMLPLRRHFCDCACPPACLLFLCALTCLATSPLYAVWLPSQPHFHLASLPTIPCLALFICSHLSHAASMPSTVMRRTDSTIFLPYRAHAAPTLKVLYLCHCLCDLWLHFTGHY